MPVRAKFKVHEIVKRSSGGPTIKMHPVYSTNPEHENKKFWDSTPSGNIEMQIQNEAAANAFELGKEYYVDFTPAS